MPPERRRPHRGEGRRIHYNRRTMQREYHRWYTGRLGRDMGTCVYGHWGTPLLAFPTSGGDEHEMEGQGMVGGPVGVHRRRAHQAVHGGIQQRPELLQQGRPPAPPELDAAAVGRVHPLGSHPLHPHALPGLVSIATMGASLGAYHAANTMLKHPDAVRACFAMSGVYDMRASWTASATTTSTSTTRSTTSGG